MKKNHSLNKEKIKVVLLEGIHPLAQDYFRQCGYNNVEIIEGALTGEELVAKIHDAHILGIRSRTKVTPELLGATQKLIGLGCFCIGTNQVALQDTALAGIPVFNAPHSNTRSVAELVIGQTVMLFRGIFPKSMAAHRAKWQKSAKDSHEIRGKTMGIVGYGHIGSQVSILAEAMGMRVLYFDIVSKLPLGNARPTATLEALLAESDIVTLHVPEDETTRNMIDEQTLAAMPRGAYLINASRGSVVDIDALARALQQEHLLGAAVDVFPVEPKSNRDPFHNPLVGMDNVILSPHIGGSTQEAQENIAREVAGKLVDFSDTGATEGAVNFPAVKMPIHADGHRILHVHHNVPGILRQINMILAEENINVLGQYLATNQDIGYVVLDIAKDVSQHALKIMKTIEGTIRARVLF